MTTAISKINSRASLDRSPKGKNWVERSGGLPMYIRRIANHLHQEKGMTISHAIAVAVNAVKKMCATGDLNWKGKQNVNAKSRAEACAAVASWTKKKAQARVSKTDVRGRPLTDEEFINLIVGQTLSTEIHKGCGCEKDKRKKEKMNVSKSANPFWDGDGLQGVGQPRNHLGRWVKLPGGSRLDRVGVWEMEDGSFGVFEAEAGKRPRTPSKTFKSKRAALKRAAQDFEVDKKTSKKRGTGSADPGGDEFPGRIVKPRGGAAGKSRPSQRDNAPRMKGKNPVNAKERPSAHGKGMRAHKSPSKRKVPTPYSNEPEYKALTPAEKKSYRAARLYNGRTHKQALAYAKSQQKAVARAKNSPPANKDDLKTQHLINTIRSRASKGAKLYDTSNREITVDEAIRRAREGLRVRAGKTTAGQRRSNVNRNKKMLNILAGEDVFKAHNDLLEEVDSFFDDAPGTFEFDVRGKIEKRNDEKQMVFGWASVAKKADGTVVVDKQGDVLEDIDQMEKVAYDFVLHSRDGGEMHVRKGVSTMVESFVATPEKCEAMGIPEGTLPVGWWVGFKVNDKGVWDKVKKGHYKMFSVHGSGLRKALED